MRHPYLSILRLSRWLSTGDIEELSFNAGVNLLVGPPNSGKTKWLETLDYLLGDSGTNPFDGAEEERLADKYKAASAELALGDERILIERRWGEPGAKTKIFLGEEKMTAGDFQQLLMRKLGIPLLNFPKGNPMSGQTWPELSFRTLLRHIYRQQRFWSSIADQQPEAEQHACLLQFLGLAEHLFTDEYGQLVQLKLKSEQLKARRDQYGQTLNELARDVVSVPGLNVGVNMTTVRQAEELLTREIETLRQQRTELISGAIDQAVPSEHRGNVERLSDQRATVIIALEEARLQAKATAERLEEVRRYFNDLKDEIDRMARAEDAGAILADLKITHCPACDQPVTDTFSDPENCFLCHQLLPEEPLIEELGAVRLRFERDRLTAELEEASQLLDVLGQDERRLSTAIVATEEQYRMLENELAPARQAVSALVQEDVSAIDMALGELNERQRQLSRISTALEQGQQLTDLIATLEREIQPLQVRVDEAARATDFGVAASQLEEGMNAYLNAINNLRSGVWRHNPIKVDVTRWNFTVRVGTRRWQAALGGTDTLYFLMAYHFGLLTLSNKSQCHYPGLSIIDLPGEFSGEAIKDKENFIVQPFIDLLNKEEYEGAQVIITGASFAGLHGAHRLHLTDVYVS